MGNKFKTVAICCRKKNKQILEIAFQACEVLSNLKLDLIVNDKLSSLKEKVNCKIVKEKKLMTADLMIVIGGDGSILSFARNFGSKGVPILGINLGNLGFLADIPPKNISQSLMEVVNGKYLRDKRFFLEATIDAGTKSHLALNEIVIHSGAVAQLIEFELYVDGIFVYRQKADGLIINSPTGSTAYSLSGGGPIIHPDVKAITLLPMFPHSLSSSPLLINDKSKIEILVVNKNKATISLDSHNSLPLNKGEVVTIEKSKSILSLIHPRDHNFYSACRNKLGWSNSITTE